MGTFLVEVLLDVLGDLFERSSSLYAAYRSAWRKRRRLGEVGVELLRQELVGRSVPGAYDAEDSPRIAPAIEAWRAGREPREVRTELREVSKAVRRRGAADR